MKNIFFTTVIATMVIFASGCDEKRTDRYTTYLQPVNCLIIASSTLEPTDSYQTSHLIDGDLNKSWQEGSDSDGTGETITFMMNKPVELDTISIANGFHKSKELYKKNCRPKEIEIITDGISRGVFTMTDKMKPQDIKFNSSITVNSLQFKIVSVYSGSDWTDCVISEIEFYLDNQFVPLNMM